MKNFLILALFLISAIVGCSSIAEDDKIREMPPNLEKVADEPETLEQASVERQKLLLDIGNLLSAMLGKKSAEKNELLSAISRDYHKIMRGMARLEASKSDFGLSWYQDIDQMLRAMYRHLELISKIQSKIEFLPDVPTSVQPQTSENIPTQTQSQNSEK